MDRFLLSVVIINYKTPDLVIDCVTSLIPELNNINATVVIVDNCSNDGSVDKLNAWLDDIKAPNEITLIASNSNSGFSGGNNLGIKSTNADYYLLLNSDTLVRKGSIDLLISTAVTNPSAGLISPRLEWPDGTPQQSCFNFHTPLSEFLFSARTSFLTNLFPKHEIALPLCSTSTHPEWTSFACVLVRKEVISDIGLMDDGYFMYYEDSDYCYHARKAGWDILNNPTARVVHLRGGSSSVKKNTAQNKRLPRYYYASRTRYFYKLYGRYGLIAANFLWWIGRSISKFRELFGKTNNHICDRQWLDIWTNFVTPLNPFKK